MGRVRSSTKRGLTMTDFYDTLLAGAIDGGGGGTGDDWFPFVRLWRINIVLRGFNLNVGTAASDYTSVVGTNNRMCFPPYLGIEGYEGYDLKVSFTNNTADDIYYAVNAYNETAISNTTSKQSISSSDTKSIAGWKLPSETMTIPTTLNGESVKAIRICFSRGSGHDVSMSEGNIDNLVIYLKKHS